MKSDPQIGISVASGDRLVGAGCKDNSNNYAVPLVDADGHLQIDVLTGGGGGTQYADGAARGTATGTLAMGDDGVNIQSLHVDSSGDAQVDILSIAAGNNNIGDVDIASIAAGDNNIGNVDVVTLPAIPSGTNLIGIVSSPNETSSIYNGTTALTPKFAKIAASSSGNNSIVAAVTSKKIRVVGYNIISNGTVNAKFQSDGAGTPVDLTGLKYLVANTGISVGYSPVGWFESASGKSLDLNLSGAIAVGGELVYIEV